MKYESPSARGTSIATALIIGFNYVKSVITESLVVASFMAIRLKV
jgi:hypothetical protein